MKYKEFIEENFLIDEPQTGKLVPFIFNKVQIKYYQELVEMGIEEKGISLALREFIVKARREGFTSLILAIFAADDINQQNPTESQVVSYKDKATAAFRKRYRRFVLSFYAFQLGISVAQIQNDSNLLEQFAKTAFSVDGSDIELRHNQAHFYCGTAAARTGGRGGVLQKLLFSEAAYYQDSEVMEAKEIIEGTAQQVDKESGWIFQESTGNGVGNYFYTTFEFIQKGMSRYMLRFYGWRSFYTEEQFNVIKSEITDPDMLKKEYPETVEEAFLSSTLSFTNREQLIALIGSPADKELYGHLEFGGVNYIDQCESIKSYLLTLQKTNPNRNFYCGLDSAKSIDRSVLTILITKELSTNGGIKCLAIDATGQGDFIPDWFEKNTNWYIHRMKFSRTTKSTMWKVLQAVLQSRLTALPKFIDEKEFVSLEWKNFFNQMINLTKQIIGDMLVVEHRKGKCNADSHNYDDCPFHDDYCDSWGLAEIGYVTLKGVPLSQRPKEEKNNLDNSLRRLLNTHQNSPTHGAGIENFN